MPSDGFKNIKYIVSMKKIYLLRHAKSSWDDSSMSDFDRPLNDRGLKDTPVMGKRLKEKGILPDLIISSPAVRALTTCQQIAQILGYALDKIKIDKRVYHATEHQLKSILQECGGEFRSVMMVGHNPGLTEFANRLTDNPIDNIPTCGAVVIDLEVAAWKDVAWDCGELEFFDFPKL
jgi:phosphohistidine phosphatase